MTLDQTFRVEEVTGELLDGGQGKQTLMQLIDHKTARSHWKGQDTGICCHHNRDVTPKPQQGMGLPPPIGKKTLPPQGEKMNPQLDDMIDPPWGENLCPPKGEEQATQRVLHATRQQDRRTTPPEGEEHTPPEGEERACRSRHQTPLQLKCKGLDPPMNNAVNYPRLRPPQLRSGVAVHGGNKRQHRKENKDSRLARQEAQPVTTYWNRHHIQQIQAPRCTQPSTWRNDMCPRGLALHHPAAPTLVRYATGGCPVYTGKNWTPAQMAEAVARGPHVSARVPDAIAQLGKEVQEKVRRGQARVVLWDSIKENPRAQLKISPVAMIPHKSRQYRAILYLSYQLKLKDGTFFQSVNDTTTLTAPAGAIDQLRQ